MGYYVAVEEGVNVYVEELNPSGTHTVLLLHGWPLNHSAYEYQLDKLPRHGIRCLAMDTRGFGRSDRPWHGYDYNRLADDVFAVINALGLKGITLGGHSMGGAIAVRYMARHNAHAVKKLALFGAAAPSFVRRADFPYGHTQTEVSGLIAQASNNRPSLLRSFNEMFFYQYINPPLADWFFHLGLSAAGWATAACLVTLRDATLFGDLSRIHVPTLILHGVHDLVCPFAFAEAQHRAIHSSVIIPYEHSGHGLFYEQREAFNDDLLRFIQV
jgi:non-heme chloroperoxidase